MNEEEIKKRMAERLQGQIQGQLQEHAYNEMQKQQAEEMLKKLSSHILEPEAKERLSNLRLVKPDIAMQLELYLVQLFQAGQIRGKITESQLVAILSRITEKKDFKIRRK